MKPEIRKQIDKIKEPEQPDSIKKYSGDLHPRYLSSWDHRAIVSYEEAKKIVKRLGLRTKVDYQKNYNKHSGLPADPHGHYNRYDPGKFTWNDFLGKTDAHIPEGATPIPGCKGYYMLGKNVYSTWKGKFMAMKARFHPDGGSVVTVKTDEGKNKSIYLKK